MDPWRNVNSVLFLPDLCEEGSTIFVWSDKTTHVSSYPFTRSGGSEVEWMQWLKGGDLLDRFSSRFPPWVGLFIAFSNQKALARFSRWSCRDKDFCLIRDCVHGLAIANKALVVTRYWKTEPLRCSGLAAMWSRSHSALIQVIKCFIDSRDGVFIEGGDPNTPTSKTHGYRTCDLFYHHRNDGHPLRANCPQPHWRSSWSSRSLNQLHQASESGGG